MNRLILHIDFNSYFATVEQQANPRLRGKPIGVTGGDRLERTVLGAASIEAKRQGVRTGMTIREARMLCPNIILVKGDSDKYLSCTKKFLSILKNYSPLIEVFSIDEAFIELSLGGSCQPHSPIRPPRLSLRGLNGAPRSLPPTNLATIPNAIQVAQEIKRRVHERIGEWVSCSIGISYNKRMAKLAGSMYKPDGLVTIADEEAAQFVLDRTPLDEICGIGGRIKKRLNNMGIFSFSDLRKLSLENLLASFKSYGQILFNMARGIDETPIVPFYEKHEVESVGHRHTLFHDTDDIDELKQTLLKLSELIGRRLRSKKLVGRTISLYFRYAFDRSYFEATGHKFMGDGMQSTILNSDDGLDIFNAGWKIFLKLWNGEKVRMIGISIGNVSPKLPTNLSFLSEVKRRETITQVLDKVNNSYGEFSLFRGILLKSAKIRRRPNPFLADYRFKL